VNIGVRIESVVSRREIDSKVMIVRNEALRGLVGLGGFLSFFFLYRCVFGVRFALGVIMFENEIQLIAEYH
jgi:hypothetical protein